MMIDFQNFTFDCHPKFQKEFNKIIRKHQCPSLNDDFERLKIILIQDIEENGNFSVNFCQRIAGLDKCVCLPAFIIKKFRCKKIKKGSNSGFRLTFLFDKEEQRFYFCEIFHKNKKELPDKERINQLFNS